MLKEAYCQAVTLDLYLPLTLNRGDFVFGPKHRETSARKPAYRAVIVATGLMDYDPDEKYLCARTNRDPLVTFNILDCDTLMTCLRSGKPLVLKWKW